MELKRGDVVRLKSGGPIMTVGKVSSDGEVICAWFNHAEDVKREVFHQDLLEGVNEED